MSTRVPVKSFATPVAFTEKVEEPTAVGVPEITPSFDSVSPTGSVPPASSHVVFDGIPLVSSVAEYELPSGAALRAWVATKKRCGQTSNVKRVSALRFSQSFTASHALKVPVSVAIPSTSAVW